MRAKVTRSNLSLNAKKEILEDIANGMLPDKAKIKYKAGLSTVYKIQNEKEKILSEWEASNNPNRKRNRKSKDELNQATYDFFKLCRSKNIPLSGPMLKQKALIIAKKLGMEEFAASNGWLDKFKDRYGIQFKVLCGESASADIEIADQWKQKIPHLCKEYDLSNIFNCDETGLYFRQLPKRTLEDKAIKAKGIKLARERLSILLCCSLTGQKLIPLVIGNLLYQGAS